MRRVPYTVMTDLTPKEAALIVKETCPKCDGELSIETCGPLTDFSLCDECSLAFDEEEAELAGA